MFIHFVEKETVVKRFKFFLMAIIAFGFVAGGCPCGPPKVEPIEEIKPNETAFVVPLEGATKKDQAQFMSLEYLEGAKVATKRVIIPVRERDIGRAWWSYEWIPTVKVIKVDRTPITREWTAEKSTGTTKANQAIYVESKDSIGFGVGVNVTAMIQEEDAAQFLYAYAGKPLQLILDQNVRGLVTAILSREFGVRDLQACKADKKPISDILDKEVKEKFAPFGVTVTNIGLVGGLAYEDKEIQKSINDAYVAEMSITQAQNEKKAQDERNELMVAKAIAERKAAEEFAKAQEAMIAKVRLQIEQIKAEAMKAMTEKWNGEVPKNVVPNGGMFLFNMDIEGAKTSHNGGKK